MPAEPAETPGLPAEAPEKYPVEYPVEYPAGSPAGTILYVAHYDPSTDFNGAKMRLLALARICTRLGRHFVFVRSSDKSIYTLDRDGQFRLRGPFEEERQFRAEDVLCVIYSWFWISQHSDGIATHLRLADPRVPVVLDTIDAVGTRQNREFLTTDMQTPTSSFALATEAREVARADWVLAITDEERHYFGRMTDRPVCVIGYSEEEAPPERVRRDVSGLAGRTDYVTGFFGSKNYANYHSAIRSAHVAWMSGRVTRFVLAGSVCGYEDLCLRLQARYGDWLEIAGRVEAPADFYERVDFATSLLAFGSGIKIKVIESLAHGVPVICNAIALEGLTHLEALEQGLFRAETAFEYTAVLERGLLTPAMQRDGVAGLAEIQRARFEAEIAAFLARIAPAA